MRDRLAGHPDRVRWNSRYEGRMPEFGPHDLATTALRNDLPDGPVLELASGPSGSALLAAAAGRRVTAVDVSDVALGLLRAEAERRGLGRQVDLVHADLGQWQPDGTPYALVLCTGYWDPAVFGRAAAAVAHGGLLAWQALTEAARIARPALPAAWCLRPGEPACLLPPGFTVLQQADLPAPADRPAPLDEPAQPGRPAPGDRPGDTPAGTWRRLLARRARA